MCIQSSEHGHNVRRRRHIVTSVVTGERITSVDDRVLSQMQQTVHTG